MALRFAKGSCAFVLAVVLSAASVGANAQEITTTVSGATRVEFDDNRLLVVDMPQQLTLITVSPKLTTRIRGPRYDAKVYGGVNYGQSLDPRVEADRADFLGGASLDYEWSASALNVNANYLENSVRDSQFLDTGQTATDATQRRLTSAVTWRGKVSDYTSLVLGGGYERTDQSRRTLTDFNFFYATTGLARELSERLTLEVDVRLQRLDPDTNLINGTNSVQASANATWRISEATTLTVEAGAIYSDAKVNSQTDFTGKAELAYQFDPWSASLIVSREETPSSDGTLRVTETAAGSFSYDLATTVSIGARVDVGRTRSLNPGLSLFPTRTRRLTASPHIIWTPWETLAFELTYRRREFDRQRLGGTAGSNTVMFELRFHYPQSDES